MLICTLASSAIHAHSKGYTHIEHSLYAGASLTLRSDDMMESGQPYLIPGTLMGGEANPYEKGLSLDEASIAGGFAWTKQVMLLGELSAHEHSNDTELELETLAISYRPSSSLAWYVSAGKMPSRISPSANWHASRASFSDAWLQSDIHFGRHGNDNGLRLSYEPGSWQLGLEAWNGSQWPASSRQGTLNVYGFKDGSFHGTRFRVGAWLGRSKSEDRSDERFEEGHSHSGTMVNTTISEYGFSGDIDGFGAYLSTESSAGQAFGKQQSVLFEFEYVHQNHKGKLTRSTQIANIEYAPETYRIGLGWRAGDHVLKVQQEHTIVTNEISTNVDAVFLSESNLENNKHEPKRWTAAWHWQYDTSITTKLEWVSEKLVDQNDTQARVNLSLSCAFDLLRQL